MIKHNTDYKVLSQSLRKNMTKEERKLWYDCLKTLPVQFYRQRVIENFIVDFCCPVKKLIIELDGSQHYEDDGKEKDRQRDERLVELGYNVLRYSNRDINECFDNVCADIFNKIKDRE